MRLVLASASPRRQELLQIITPDFTVDPADIDEGVADSLPAETRPAFLAREKALAVARRRPGELVLGCDTGVLVGSEMLGKPSSEEEAAAMLRRLSGCTHRVVTGCCLAQNALCWTFSCTTRVTFYDLSEERIAEYVATPEPYDKAGGYGIQGAGAVLVRSIEGDYNNVVGLPVSALARVLRRGYR